MSHFAKILDQPLPLIKRAFLKELSWYALFPFLLLIAENSLALIHQNSFLVLLALSAFAMPQLFKKIGLIVFLTLLAISSLFFRPYPSTGEFFWLSGLLLSFGLTAAIVYLIHAEKESVALAIEERREEEHRLALSEVQASNEEKTRELEALKEEIERLAEEAKQRRIEKQMLDQQFCRLRQDLDAFHEGREELLSSVIATKEESLTRLHAVEERESALVAKEESLSRHLAVEERERVLGEREKVLAERESVSLAEPVKNEPFVQTLTPCQSDSESLIASNGMERRVAVSEGLYKQLRSQFEEKSEQLSLTRKELFILEGKLLSEEKEKALLAFEPVFEPSLIKEFQTLWAEKSSLEDEIKVLEELVSRTHQG